MANEKRVYSAWLDVRRALISRSPLTPKVINMACPAYASTNNIEMLIAAEKFTFPLIVSPVYRDL